MPKEKRFLLPVIILIAAAFLFFFPTAEDEDPIRIGATMSKTGDYNTQGIAAANGYRLWEKHINESGGLLGRPVEFIIYDDASDPDQAISLYEKLIGEEQVDLVMGPYGSTLTEAVAPVTEKHSMVQISPLGATTSIWEQGREYLFMVLPPAELFLGGLIDMADERGLERVAIIYQDELFPEAAGLGAVEMARERGMEVVVRESYPTGTEDFLPYLQKVEETGAQVLGMAASPLDDFIRAAAQMEANNIHVNMFATSGAVQQFQEALGKTAEYAYGLSAWEPSLPYPGIERFTNDYRETYQLEPSFHAAGAYGSCQLLQKAVENAGSLDSGAIRRELLNLETQTVFSDFAVDERGYQIANTGVFIQWQDGKKEVVWPDEYATAEPRFPTPPWGQRERAESGKTGAGL